jgi:hypothetical protein
MRQGYYTESTFRYVAKILRLTVGNAHPAYSFQSSLFQSFDPASWILDVSGTHSLRISEYRVSSIEYQVSGLLHRPRISVGLNIQTS